MSNESGGNLSPVGLLERRRWNERWWLLRDSARAWKVAAAVMAGWAMWATYDDVQTSKGVKVIPVFTEVDKLGETLAVGRIQSGTPADPRVIKAMLAEWIVDMRSVSVDPVAQKLAFNRAYKWLDKASAGNRVFVDWMTANTAREQATTNTIQVTLENVFPKGGDTWEMDWSEQKYDLKGVEDGLPSHWYAYVTIAISPPLTEQDAIANPIGMYLETLVWGDRQAGRK